MRETWTRWTIGIEIMLLCHSDEVDDTVDSLRNHRFAADLAFAVSCD